MFHLISENGENKKDIKAFNTFLFKCAWKQNNKEIIYGLSEDFYDSRSKDILIQYNLETNEIIPLSSPDFSINATDLFFSTDEKKLFFINKLNGKLYSLEL